MQRTRVAYAVSRMADVKTWRSPVLLMQGDDEPRGDVQPTPCGWRRRYARRACTVEEKIFPDEVHDFLLHQAIGWTAYTRCPGLL